MKTEEVIKTRKEKLQGELLSLEAGYAAGLISVQPSEHDFTKLEAEKALLEAKIAELNWILEE